MKSYMQQEKKIKVFRQSMDSSNKNGDGGAGKNGDGSHFLKNENRPHFFIFS